MYMLDILDKLVVRYLLPRAPVVVPERQRDHFAAHRAPFCLDLSRDLLRSISSELVRYRDMEAALLEVVGVCMVSVDRESADLVQSTGQCTP